MRGSKILYYRQEGMCWFCGNQLEKIVVVHHINGDHKDNRLANRAAVHQMCHIRHHISLRGKIKRVNNTLCLPLKT